MKSRPLSAPAGWPPRSAYLHLPFCHRRCFYCDFPVVPLGDRADGARSGSIATYLDWLQAEIAAAPAGPPLATAYFGGGTPSLLTPEQIGRLLKALRERFGLMDGAELTLELDPASFDAPRLAGYLAQGINRVSLGGQSFDDGVLAGLGRRHRRQDLLTAAGWLQQAWRRGELRSWSLDLIQAVPLGLLPAAGAGAHPGRPVPGLPSAVAAGAGATASTWRRSPASASPAAPAPVASGARPAPATCSAPTAPAVLEHWRGQLRQAIALQPPHLSIYDLSIEPGTVFEHLLRQGRLDLPDEDLAADLQALTHAVLVAAGYGHYEISNYARPGHASRHNRVYWSGAAWWGFGMGATSGLGGERQARPRTREAYRQWLASWIGERADAGSAPSSAHAPAAAVVGSGHFPLEEQLLVGLRRREGVNLERLWRELALPPAWLAQLRQALASFETADLLRIEGPRWRLSDPEGLALSNAVLREILSWWQERDRREAAGPAAGH